MFALRRRAAAPRGVPIPARRFFTQTMSSEKHRPGPGSKPLVTSPQSVSVGRRRVDLPQCWRNPNGPKRETAALLIAEQMCVYRSDPTKTMTDIPANS